VVTGLSYFNPVEGGGGLTLGEGSFPDPPHLPLADAYLVTLFRLGPRDANLQFPATRLAEAIVDALSSHPVTQNGAFWTTPLRTPLPLDANERYGVIAERLGQPPQVMASVGRGPGYAILSPLLRAGPDHGQSIFWQHGVPYVTDLEGQLASGGSFEFEVTAAPEPATLAMLAGGLIVFAAGARLGRTTGRRGSGVRSLGR
jgi:hypothetical protein